ncbi:Acylphosphatase [bioreactor metagenome]|uniref:Acylphosphatase n=1 Tax=bioreactor metagenome TaxID=1076179 RepID=A0A645I0V3_9ZZZZ|nr:acylphosphatase [Erysipelotrichaceae bacterium]
MERYYVIFKGRVQGVGFRYYVISLAQTKGLTGWIRNQLNGNVEMEIQGNPDTFQLVLEQILAGNGWIRITDYSIKRIPVIAESAFNIKY